MMTNWRNPLTFEFNLKILVAFVITVFGGLAMDKLGIELPETCVPVAGALIAGGLIFILVERHLKGRDLQDVITWPVVFMVAAGQLAAAVFPGTSRSGATIIFAMICGLNRPSSQLVPTRYLGPSTRMGALMRVGGFCFWGPPWPPWCPSLP